MQLRPHSRVRRAARGNRRWAGAPLFGLPDRHGGVAQLTFAQRPPGGGAPVSMIPGGKARTMGMAHEWHADALERLDETAVRGARFGRCGGGDPAHPIRSQRRVGDASGSAGADCQTGIISSMYYSTFVTIPFNGIRSSSAVKIIPCNASSKTILRQSVQAEKAIPRDFLYRSRLHAP